MQHTCIKFGPILSRRSIISVKKKNSKKRNRKKIKKKETCGCSIDAPGVALVIPVSGIRINYCHYYRWSCPYIAIFLSDACRTEMRQIAWRYLWARYAYPVASALLECIRSNLSDTFKSKPIVFFLRLQKLKKNKENKIKNK